MAPSPVQRAASAADAWSLWLWAEDEFITQPLFVIVTSSLTGKEREIYYFQNISYQNVVRVPLLLGHPSISGMWL
jgi:hypothetical protein